MKRAVFWDRDGVLNHDPGYLAQPDDTVFTPGAPIALARSTAAGYANIIVTNQAGIARGYYSEADFHHYMDWFCSTICRDGGTIHAVYFCPHHPTDGLGDYRRDSPDRKPNPGMILRAMDEHRIERHGSFLIGDSPSDLAAAEAAGLDAHHFTGGSLDAFVDPLLRRYAGDGAA
ncbi:MAG: HAD family hydrolase [Alphaproteobacteria bacterium]|nr:HAD family hydrolase [Alphaproteobacteria bacterium]